MTAPDRYDLERFISAQDAGGMYASALAELRAGRKDSHWIWFVFPQLAGLGSSGMARRYAIGSLDEARSYAGHPVLGARLRESAQALLAHRDRGAEAILGPIDALKLRSSMTLFIRAAPEESTYSAVLTAFFAGRPDERSEQLLATLEAAHQG